MPHDAVATAPDGRSLHPTPPSDGAAPSAAVAGAATVSRAASARVVFAGAAALGALHWIDAAVVDRWRGESIARGLPAALVAIAFAAGAAVLWPRLPRGPRALVAFVAGLITVVAGVLSVSQVAAGQTEGGAWSGLLLLPAGVAMLACVVAVLRG